MKFAVGVILSACSLIASPAWAARYSTINAAEVERLLGGSEQEKSVATFYLGGALDALSVTNTMMAEQGSPLFCPGAEDDLRPSTLTPKFLQHIAELRRKPRAADALQSLTASTILMVLLTQTYPCEITDPGPLAPNPQP